MQETDRNAFDEILGEIFAAMDKPLGESQRSSCWKSLTDMSILEFARVRDHLLREWREQDPPRKFTPGDIWRARKALRAAPPASSADDGWRGDDWDQKANLRLYSVILRAWQTSNRHFDPSQTRTLVAFKNRWAELMRASGPFAAIPMDEQDDCWSECIRQAEAEIGRAKAA